MDSFNKVISFVLGLVVVLVFFAVVTGRLKLGKFSPSFVKKTTPTPTPISTVKIPENGQVSGSNADTNTGTNPLGNTYKLQPTKIASKPSSIPSAGLPTLFIPFLLAGGMGGAFLRKAGKK